MTFKMKVRVIVLLLVRSVKVSVAMCWPTGRVAAGVVRREAVKGKVSAGSRVPELAEMVSQGTFEVAVQLNEEALVLDRV